MIISSFSCSVMTFKVASRFRDAANIINILPENKLSLFLMKIIQKLHIKNVTLFTSEEQDQLKEVFGLSQESLENLIQVSCYIFEEAAFSSTDPEKLYEILLEAGYDEARSKVIGKLWKAEAPAFLSKLKERTLGYSTLIKSNHNLNLRMSDSADAKQQDPSAIFELTLGSVEKLTSSSSISGSSQSNEVVTVEFSHTELSRFFSDLDRIQQQLDSLAAS